jgi:hypothetical protein
MQSTSSESPPDSTIIRTGSDGRLRYSPEHMFECAKRHGHNPEAWLTKTFYSTLRFRFCMLIDVDSYGLGLRNPVPAAVGIDRKTMPPNRPKGREGGGACPSRLFGES